MHVDITVPSPGIWSTRRCTMYGHSYLRRYELQLLVSRSEDFHESTIVIAVGKYERTSVPQSMVCDRTRNAIVTVI